MPMKRLHNGNRRVKTQQVFTGLVLAAGILVSDCSIADVPQQHAEDTKVDPYENLNRKLFVFNDSVDDYVAAPISNAYKWITPQFMQTGVFNFFNNLKNVNVVINDVLQAKFSKGAEDTGRFAINSTLGLGGIVDVAKDVGLEQNEEDFDQTLAVWGVPQGSYLVLPILGPTTLRGIPGAIFDTAANPSSYVGLPVQLVSMLNTRASAEGSLKFIDEAALDPYVFTRESFLQWRNNLATDGRSEASSDVDDLEGESMGSIKTNVSPVNIEKKTGFALRLNAETKDFTQLSKTFSNAAQSFDATSKSYEEAGRKLDTLNSSKKHLIKRLKTKD